MGRKFPADAAPRAPAGAAFRLFCALLLVLLASGCAASGASSDGNQNQRRGFYGGISVGGAVP